MGLLPFTAGLEIFVGLARSHPLDAARWMMEGGRDSALADLTGQRAHEKLVDALRAFVFEVEKRMRGGVRPALVDSMMATCMGANPHPSKDVRDAFRSALAKLATTLPPKDLASIDVESADHRRVPPPHCVLSGGDT
jgi:hypothetical protein